MKRTILLLFAAITAVTFMASCGDDDEFNPDDENAEVVENDPNRKILVAYFSGTGNTQRLAEAWRRGCGTST